MFSLEKPHRLLPFPRHFPAAIVCLVACALLVGCREKKPEESINDPGQLRGIIAEREAQITTLKREVSDRKNEISGLNEEIATLKKKIEWIENQAYKWWMIAVGAISGIVIGVVLSLVIGAGMGSRTRRDFERVDEGTSAAEKQEDQP